MNLVIVSFSYLGWIYSEGWKEFLRAWFNYHWFLFHFFSVNVLLGSLFAPWHRLSEGKTRGFDPGKFAERIVINIVLRIVGFVVRGTFILAAIACEILLFVLGGLFFMIFILSPLAIPLMFFAGVLLFLL